MGATPAVYKQEKVIFTIAGIPVDDIAEDSEITVEYDRDRITKQNDIRDGGIFSVRVGKPAKITVPIMQHSRWNTVLLNYRNLDKMIPISLSDRNDYGNGTTFITAHAMIQDSGASFGAEATSRSYVFEVMHLTDVTAPEL